MMGGALIFPTFTHILYLNDKNPGGGKVSLGGGYPRVPPLYQNPALTFY